MHLTLRFRWTGVLLVLALGFLAYRFTRGEGWEGAADVVFLESFEDPSSDHAIHGMRRVEVGAGAHGGSHVAELDPGAAEGLRFGTLRRELELEVGRRYRIDVALQAPGPSAGLRYTVSVDGESPRDIRLSIIPSAFEHAELPRHENWQVASGFFFAKTRKTTLVFGPLSRFQEASPWRRVWLDTLRVRALPEVLVPARDLRLRVTAPSDVVVGEEIDVQVATLVQQPRGAKRNYFERCEWPVPAGLRFETTDAEAVHGASTNLSEAVLAHRVRFRTPGLQRVTVVSEDGVTQRSNPIRVHAVEPASRHYWGDIHIHTHNGHADWLGGSSAANLEFARDFADLDFAALTEHFAASLGPAWIAEIAPATQAFHDPGRFVTFFAAETMTFQGHRNYYLVTDEPFAVFHPVDAYGSNAGYASFLRGKGRAFLEIPHHFALLDPVDWRLTSRKTNRLAEIYSTHGTSENAFESWRHPDDFSLNYAGAVAGSDYRSALARGHRLGLIASSDSHHLQPGLSGLACVDAEGLSRAALFDALAQRRCHATTGARILLDVTVAEARAGSEIFLDAGAPLEVSVRVNGTERIRRVEIIRDGEVVSTAEPGMLDYEATTTLAPFDPPESGAKTSYVYVRLFQDDEQRAWSSPVWISQRGLSDFVVENPDLVFEGDALAVSVQNAGELAATGTLRLYSSRADARLADRPVVAFADPTLLTRLEPLGPRRVRVFVALYIPSSFRKAADFEGSGRFEGARVSAVTADPRRALSIAQDGSFTWKDRVGYRNDQVSSLSGQIVDFELVVEVDDAAHIVLEASLDGRPLESAYFGREPIDGGERLSISAPAPLLKRELTLAGGVTTELTFEALPRDATYVVVLDGDEAVAEISETNNAAWVLVPEVPYEPRRWR